MTDKSKAAGLTPPTDEPIQSCISQLQELIKLDYMTRNYPDNYVQPTSRFASDNASAISSALCSPEGCILGKLVYRENQDIAPGILECNKSTLSELQQAIARLIDGSNTGSHSVLYKDCYTTPSSLTTAFISAPGARRKPDSVEPGVRTAVKSTSM